MLRCAALQSGRPGRALHVLISFHGAYFFRVRVIIIALALAIGMHWFCFRPRGTTQRGPSIHRNHCQQLRGSPRVINLRDTFFFFLPSKTQTFCMFPTQLPTNPIYLSMYIYIYFFSKKVERDALCCVCCFFQTKRNISHMTFFFCPTP